MNKIRSFSFIFALMLAVSLVLSIIGTAKYFRGDEVQAVITDYHRVRKTTYYDIAYRYNNQYYTGNVKKRYSYGAERGTEITVRVNPDDPTDVMLFSDNHLWYYATAASSVLLLIDISTRKAKIREMNFFKSKSRINPLQ